MYGAESRWSRGDASLVAGLFLCPGVRVQTIQSAGLRFDSRFLAPVDAPQDTVNVFLLLDGWIECDGVRTAAPCWWSVVVDEFECRRSSARPFRVGGSPRRSIEICVAAADVHVPTGLSQGVQRLPNALESCAEQLFFEDEDVPRAERVTRCVELLSVLDRLHWVSVSDDAGVRPVDDVLQRIIDSFRPLYREHDTGAYANLLAELGSVSLRQTTRDVASLTARYRLPGNNLRQLFRVLRLRRAAILLSTEQLSITDVAHEVGYSGPDAMGRAFRDAGLPTPSAIRQSLLSDSME